MLTEEEQTLITDLGIYGCWLLKHAKVIGNSDRLRFRKLVMYRYDQYTKATADHYNIHLLLDAIDKYIKYNNYEPLKDTYPLALEDLKLYRQQLNATV